MQKVPLILASASQARSILLNSIGLVPDLIEPSDIEEKILKKESPKFMVQRLAKSKAEAVAARYDNCLVVAADSAACIGTRTLEKALDLSMVKDSLTKLSGRNHKFYTSIHIIKKLNKILISRRERIVCTLLKFKRLSQQELSDPQILKEGLNKAGGYAIEGLAQTFCIKINGSMSNVMGLPLFELKSILSSLL